MAVADRIAPVFKNIRHIQHHAAQLADRLRAFSNVGTRWAGARRKKPAV